MRAPRFTPILAFPLRGGRDSCAHPSLPCRGGRDSCAHPGLPRSRGEGTVVPTLAFLVEGEGTFVPILNFPCRGGGDFCAHPGRPLRGGRGCCAHPELPRSRGERADAIVLGWQRRGGILEAGAWSELDGVHDLDNAAIAQGVEVAVGAGGVLKPAAGEVGADVG